MITLKTNLGDIFIELDEENAPKTCENFIQYVQDGHFDGTIFHRVIDNFMIQGGGFLDDMTQKATRDPIENEAKNGLSNEVGTIAMARTMDPHSASAQFFINVVDNDRLDPKKGTYRGNWGYAVFGAVIEGMEVVDKIVNAESAPNGPGGAPMPVKPIVINKMSMITYE